ncbi:MAG: EpsG family protein, partial [Rikenellaceae bacterium]
MEYLSQCIGDLAAYLNIDQVYFIINSFVAIYPIYYVVKRESVDPKISLLLLFLLPFLYLESFSIVRNSSAYAIVFLAIYQLNKGRFLIYLLFVFIASLFHSSGLVGLLFLPFKFIKFNRNITVVIFTISFFAGSFFVDIISLFSPDTYITTKLIAYASNDGGVGRFMKYFIILLNVVNLINWKQLIDFDKRNLLYLNLINIGAS